MREKTQARRNAPRKRTHVQAATRQAITNRARRREALELQGRAQARPDYPEPEADQCFKPDRN
ncbi:MAG: hypothetical protein ACK5QH_08995 [Rubrivivax sp.]